MALGGPPIPVVPLAVALGVGAAPRVSADDLTPVLILQAGDRRMAFTVEELLAEQAIAEHRQIEDKIAVQVFAIAPERPNCREFARQTIFGLRVYF